MHDRFRKNKSFVIRCKTSSFQESRSQLSQEEDVLHLMKEGLSFNRSKQKENKKTHFCLSKSILIYNIIGCESSIDDIGDIKHPLLTLKEGVLDTRVAIYISGLIMKKQICRIEIGFIVFQNILHDDQYTFACV